MLLGFLLFEALFVHVVAITFTALVLNELLMVALTIRTWHGLMVLAQLLSIAIYILSLVVLNGYFGEALFNLTLQFSYFTMQIKYIYFRWNFSAHVGVCVEDGGDNCSQLYSFGTAEA